MRNRERGRDNLRQLFLLKILYERTDEFHSLSTNEIVTILDEEYDISAHRITIKEDIKSFQEYGIEIAEERKSQNHYRLISRMFSVAELKILIDAIQSAKFITANQSAELSKRIAALASCHELESLKRHITVEERYKSQNVQSLYIVDAINTAINKEKKISFRYFSYSPTKRKVPKHGGELYAFSPYYLVWNGDHYYTVGYSDKHKGIGSFRVDRFMEVPIIMDDNAVPMPKDFKINEYINSMLHMYNSEHTDVELICDNDVMDSIIDKFGTGIKTSRVDKEHFKAIVNVAVNHVFFAWVFGFCGKVRINEPYTVRTHYCKMLEDSIRNNQI
jgi:predicted DNA-binding transcriptional regulator YafY